MLVGELWTGFDLSWRRTPHRLNHLGSWLDPSSGTACARLGVGRWPDAGHVRTWVRSMQSPHLWVDERVSELEVRADRGERAKGQAQAVEVDAPWPGATAVLGGFALSCTSHPVGVHTQGLGVLLDLQTGPTGRLRVQPRAFVQADRSPDPLTRWRGSYAFKVTVYWTALAVRPGHGAWASGGPRPCVTRWQRGRRQHTAVHGVLRGTPGHSAAAIGLRGFAWAQHHRAQWDRGGRFVRRMGVHIGPVDYEPDTGCARFQPGLGFSNAGWLPHPVRVRHRLWTTLLQLEGDVGRARPVELPFRSGVGADVEQAASL